MSHPAQIKFRPHGTFSNLNLMGRVFSRLTVINGPIKANRGPKWLCKCDCGEMTTPFASALVQGTTKSCGCLARDNRIKATTKHGLSKRSDSQKLYSAWHSMMKRCYDVENDRYKDYGGRGIIVCERWHELVNFAEDMAAGCKKGLSLDRIDNEGNYEPSNCKWSTPKEQGQNRRTTIFVTHNGKTMCLKDWAAEIGLSYSYFIQKNKRR